MSQYGWYRFEWDDENKKNGNVQQMMSTFWMGEPIAADGYVSFCRIKGMGLPGCLPVGT
jgi:hypothetical protein